MPSGARLAMTRCGAWPERWCPFQRLNRVTLDQRGDIYIDAADSAAQGCGPIQ
jgi:hypothetical protein